MKKEKYKKIVTNNSGVTLVALVVTIIVLLILAGITVSIVVSNNGIIAETNQAKEDIEIAAYHDDIQVSRAHVYIRDHQVELDALIKQIYDENIVPDGSITKLDDENARLVTPEGYVFHLTADEIEYLGKEGSEKEPTKPNPGNQGNTTPGGEGNKKPNVQLENDKIVIDDVVITVLGDVEEIMELEENMWGKQFVQGQIFRYKGTYYIMKQDNYIPNGGNLYGKTVAEYIEENFIGKICVKLNPEKGFITPSKDTEEGDLKYENGKIYFYNPYGESDLGYLDPNWWPEITQEPA